MYTEVADLISSVDYRSFNERFIASKRYMPHTIIYYLFNIGSIFTCMAKNPTIVRRFKIEGIIDADEIRLANIMTSPPRQQPPSLHCELILTGTLRTCTVLIRALLPSSCRKRSR